MSGINYKLSPIYYIDSDKDSHFIADIAQNAQSAVASLSFPSFFEGQELLIISVSLQLLTSSAREFDLFIWTKSTADDTDLDVDEFLEFVNFPSASQKQIAGANQFYLAKTGLEIPYKDLDDTKKLHVTMCNRSATTYDPTAPGTDAMRLRFGVRNVWW